MVRIPSPSRAARASLLLAAALAPQASAGTPDSLTTMFASNNGLDGNMFNVTAIEDLQIVSFDCNFDAGAVTIEVYTCPGGYQGNETNPGAWTLVGSGPTTGAGQDLPTPLPFGVDIQIPAGQTMGIYITGATGAGINYTNGSALGAIAAQNADLSIDEGWGVSHPFGGNFSPRVWNGTVYYYTDTGDPYCFGDGLGGVCPCGNFAQAEAGCANSTGSGGQLVGDGSTSASQDTLSFSASLLPPNRPALLVAGSTDVNTGQGAPFGDGLRCASGSLVSLGVRVTSASGDASWGPGLAGQGGFTGGSTRYFQVLYRDSHPQSPCGLRYNATNAVRVALQG